MDESAASRRRRTSWNAGRADKNRPTAASRIGYRILATLCALTIVGVFAWLLRSLARDRPVTHVALVLAPAARHWSAPPLPFPQAIRDDCRGIPDSNRFGSVKELKLPDLAAEDVLVVYVLAHGFSWDGTAYLLDESDFGAVSDARRGAEVSTLLRQVRRSKAATKLVVLDSGRFPLAPSQGMFVNEFPRLLEKATTETKDPTLWVLNSNDQFEVSQVSCRTSRSIFGKAFVDALREGSTRDPRAADATLKDLFDFVHKRCAGFQTPVLMNGALGRIRNREEHDRRLGSVRLPPVSRLEEPDGRKDEPATKQAAASQTTPGPDSAGSSPAPADRAVATAEKTAAPGTTTAVETDRSKTPEARGPVGASAERQSAPAATAETPPRQATERAGELPTRAASTGEQILATIAEAWKLRDQLRRREPNGSSIAPVDFAPHQWRRLNAILLHAEQWACFGYVRGETITLAKEEMNVENELRSLKTLKAELHEGRSHWDDRLESTTDEIRKAWERACSGGIATGAGESDEQDVRARNLVRRYADLLSLAADYVAWHDVASLTSAPADVPQETDVREFLVQLRKVGDALKDLSAGGGVRFVPEPLADLLETAEEARRRIDEQLQKRLKRALAARDPLRIEELLSTSLLEAEDRQKLLNQLFVVGTDNPDPRGTVSGAEQWERVQRRASLYQALGRLAGVELPEFRLAADPDATTGADCREWEKELAGRYFGRLLNPDGTTPSRDAAGADASSSLPFGDLALFQRAQLIDPRVADKFSKEPVAFRIPLPEGPLRFEIEVAGELRVPGDKAATLDLQVKVHRGRSDDRPAKARVSVAVPEFIQVEPVPPDKWSTGRGDRQRELILEFARGVRSVPLRLKVDWKRLSAETTTAPARQTLVLSVEALNELKDSSPPYQKEVVCLRAAPDRVELVLTKPALGFLRTAAAPARLSNGDAALRLPSFPNRLTTFRLGLKNQHDLPKQVSVKLFRLLPSESSSAPRGKLWRDNEGQAGDLVHGLLELRADLLKRAENGELEKILAANGAVAANLDLVAEANADLSADGRSVELDFTPPKSAPAAAEGAKPAEKPPAEKPAASIADGLLCLVFQNGVPGHAPWLHWIEPAPLHPHDYVRANVSYFPSGDDGEIKIDVFTDFDPETYAEPGWSGSGQKSLLKEKTVSVVCENSGDLSPIEGRNLSATLTGKNWTGAGNARTEPGVRLTIRGVKPTDRTVVAELSVDGYPRAFRFKVKTDPDAPSRGVPGKDDDSLHYRIRSVTDSKKKIFFWRDSDRPPAPAPSPAPAGQLEPVRLQNDQAAAFPAPCETLKVRVAIDYERDGSGTPSPQPFRIVLTDKDRNTYDPNEAAEGLFAERSTDFAVVRIDGGKLVVGCTVGDPELTFDSEGFSRQTVSIAVRPDRETAEDLQSRAGAMSKVKVALFDAAPDFDLAPEGVRESRSVSVGTPIRARISLVQEADRDRVQSVKYWLSDKPQPGEPPDSAAGGRHDEGWTAPIPTLKLVPGPYYLWAQVDDFAGNKPRRRSLRLNLVEASDAQAKPPPGKGTTLTVLVYDVKGGKVPFKVSGDDEAPPTVTLTIRQTGKTIAVPADRKTGIATFENLAAGEYRVVASFEHKIAGTLSSNATEFEIKEGKPYLLKGRKPVSLPLPVSFPGAQ